MFCINAPLQDELNGMLLVDNYMAEGMKPLAPHNNAFNFSEPGVLSGDIALSKQSVAMGGRFLSREDRVEPERLASMAEFV